MGSRASALDSSVHTTLSAKTSHCHEPLAPFLTQGQVQAPLCMHIVCSTTVGTHCGGDIIDLTGSPEVWNMILGAPCLLSTIHIESYLAHANPTCLPKGGGTRRSFAYTAHTEYTVNVVHPHEKASECSSASAHRSGAGLCVSLTLERAHKHKSSPQASSVPYTTPSPSFNNLLLGSTGSALSNIMHKAMLAGAVDNNPPSSHA